MKYFTALVVGAVCGLIVSEGVRALSQNTDASLFFGFATTIFMSLWTLVTYSIIEYTGGWSSSKGE